MKNKYDNFLLSVQASLAKWILYFFYKTNKWDVRGSNNFKLPLKDKKSVILSCWHGQLLTPFMHLRNKKFYGLAGLNKDDARKRWGEEQVHIWRRSFDVPPPGGESLKNTGERVMPYYKKEIAPKIAAGKNVLVVAHGNSLRSLIKEIDKISDQEIVKLEIPTGAPIIYRYSKDEQTFIKN